MKTIQALMLIAGTFASVPALAGQDAAKPAAAPAKTEAAPTQETSEGAVKLFIAAMKKGDFHKVVELADPGSEAYDDLQKMAEAFDPDRANPNIDKATFDVIKEFFTKPWKDVETKLVAEQGARAQYTLSFFYIDEKTKERKKGEDRTLDLNQFDGLWRVLVSSQLMKPATPSPIPGVAPANTTPPPPTDKPADAPAEKH
ncbi:MAG: hypothetical protein JNK58_10390 [Phycisphaerae bacterium]|nr:hypothetical protein [Phycisphaerae bacterium]